MSRADISGSNPLPSKTHTRLSPPLFRRLHPLMRPPTSSQSTKPKPAPPSSQSSYYPIALATSKNASNPSQSPQPTQKLHIPLLPLRTRFLRPRPLPIRVPKPHKAEDLENDGVQGVCLYSLSDRTSNGAVSVRKTASRGCVTERSDPRIEKLHVQSGGEAIAIASKEDSVLAGEGKPVAVWHDVQPEKETSLLHQTNQTSISETSASALSMPSSSSSLPATFKNLYLPCPPRTSRGNRTSRILRIPHSARNRILISTSTTAKGDTNAEIEQPPALANAPVRTRTAVYGGLQPLHPVDFPRERGEDQDLSHLLTFSLPSSPKTACGHAYTTTKLASRDAIMCDASGHTTCSPSCPSVPSSSSSSSLSCSTFVFNLVIERGLQFTGALCLFPGILCVRGDTI